MKKLQKGAQVQKSQIEFIKEITSSKKALIQGGGMVLGSKKPVVSTKE